uniref:Secreted protein n=1 Tax=Mesocestoides corti TaxID=53468 RepID=A0A5K3FJU4_MESCO
MMSYSFYSLILAAFTAVFTLFMFWIGKTPMAVYYQHLLRHITSKLTLRRDSSLPDIDPPLMEWLEDISRHSRHRLHSQHSSPLYSRRRALSASTINLHESHIHHFSKLFRHNRSHTRFLHLRRHTMHPVSV